MNKSLNIAFYYPKRFAFCPDDYLDYGLGATEASLVIMSRELVKLGHKVSIFNYTYKEGDFEGVSWYNIQRFKEDYFDVLISLRSNDVFKHHLNIPIKCLWVVDGDVLGVEDLFKERKIDLLITLSEFHEQKLLAKHPTLKKWLFRGDLPYDNDLYNKYGGNRKIKGKCIFCSVPHRGLQYLVDIWPLIVKNCPTSQLFITSGLELWGLTRDENDIMFEWLYSKFRKMENVTLLGKISKNELARHQSESQLMLYPNSVDELFCLSLLECLSLGTIPISTKRGALEERIVNRLNGYMIRGNPASCGYQKEFVKRAVFLINNNEVREQMSIACKSNINQYTVSNVADKWASKFYKMLNNKKQYGTK